MRILGILKKIKMTSESEIMSKNILYFGAIENIQLVESLVQ